MSRAPWIAAVLLAVAACAPPAPAPAAPDTAPAPAPDTAPPPAPSPVAEAAKLLEDDLATPEAAAGLLQRADALGAWLQDNPGAPDAGAARLLAARLTLGAVGAAAHPRSAGGRLLKERGGTEQVLRGVLTALDEAGKAGAPEAEVAAAREAVLAILAADPGVKDVRLNRSAALALMAGTSPEALAARGVWLARAYDALSALRDLAPELRVESALRVGGRLLCPRCADAHHVTPDQVLKLLLGERAPDTVICEEAVRDAQGATTPEQLTAALGRCPELLASESGGEATLRWGVNPLVVALARTARRLADMPAGDGGLAPVVQARADAVAALLDKPLVLPQPLIAVPEPPEGSQALAWVPDLGTGGLTATRDALGVILVGDAVVRAELRPVVAPEGGDFVSLGAREGLPAGGRDIVTLEALREAKPADAAQTLLSAVSETLQGAEKVAEAAGLALPQGPGGEGVLDVAVDARAPTWAVEALLDAAAAAKAPFVRFLKTATATRVLPLLVRRAPDELPEAVRPGFERPVLVHVRARSVDVWAAAGAKTPPGTPDAGAKPPEGWEPGYRGDDLVMLRLPRGEEALLDAAALEPVVAAAAFFRARDGAGPLLHVAAERDVPAADVLRVARALQEGKGTPLANPEDIWPATSCGGAGYDTLRRTPSGCATAAVVAFSALDVPSDRGLRASPAKREPKAPPTVKAPPPGPGFCDQKDIAVNMRRRTGSFRFCYERELQLKKDLQGRVEVKFTIGLDGRVKGASVSSATLKDTAVQQCLIKNIEKITFKKPEGGECVVRWPFKFNKE